MDEALQLLGAALVCLALADIYLTVLFARSGTGLISPRLNHGAWVCLRGLSRLLPGARRWLLPHSGPLLLVLNFSVWSGLLVCGFALIAWPELGSAVQATGNQATPRSFAAAVYFAGYSLATLGTGDLVPKTDSFRMLMILQAGIGFSFLTLTLTYFMSVYTALARRNRFALTLHHATADTGDATELVLGLVSEGGSHPAAQRELAQIASDLDDLYESHHFYPILHYFYFRETHYAMSRILLVALDASCLVRAALDESKYRPLADSSAAEALWRSGTFLLARLAERFLPGGDRSADNTTDENVRHWEARYRRAVARLESSGLNTNPDPEAGLNRYVELRREWNSNVAGFCRYMGRHWSEIASAETASDRDMQFARRQGA